jgi:SAM-dependent methyltransferase
VGSIPITRSSLLAAPASLERSPPRRQYRPAARILAVMATDESIRFNDGAGYERMMGRWSVLVGERFIDWLQVPKGGRWLDVGCGNGAFTQLLVERCAPVEVRAVDPSTEQLAYAKNRMQPGTLCPGAWATQHGYLSRMAPATLQ